MASARQEDGNVRGIRIAIDRGGTFTDCVGNSGSGRMEDDVVRLFLVPCLYPLIFSPFVRS